MRSKLLGNIKLFLIDVDGVILRGVTPINGAIEAVSLLRGKGARLIFPTNNSTKSRKMLAHWLNEVGIRAHIKEVLTTAYCAAQYAPASGFKKVYLIGERGLLDECVEAGLKVVKEDADGCDAVIVGLDRYFTYKKLTAAFKFIKDGAKFIATNTDASLPLEEGESPGAAAMVSGLIGCTGERPVVLGKPNTSLLKLALKMTKCSREECAVVGDRTETDIAMAKRGKCLSILVLTGVATSSKRADYPISRRPDFIFSTLKELALEYNRGI